LSGDWIEHLKKRHFTESGWKLIVVDLLHQLKKNDRLVVLESGVKIHRPFIAEASLKEETSAASTDQEPHAVSTTMQGSQTRGVGQMPKLSL
jgi:hypothetical protein